MSPEHSTTPEFQRPAGGPAPLLIVVSAPSGAGKTTLCQRALEARPTLTRAITCTTREPRPGERDGIDYYFLDATSFLKRVQAGHFLEHATVYGHSYGTLVSEVTTRFREGRDVLLNVDVQGAAAIRERAAQSPELQRALVTVFLTPPSFSILEERLRKRGSDAPQVILRRLGVARQEIAQWRHFDYLLLSASVEEDLDRFLRIIDTEKMRSSRARAPEF